MALRSLKRKGLADVILSKTSSSSTIGAALRFKKFSGGLDLLRAGSSMDEFRIVWTYSLQGSCFVISSLSRPWTSTELLPNINMRLSRLKKGFNLAFIGNGVP